MIGLSSRPASAVPGDTLRELTRATVDGSGKLWPAGTRYRPLSRGHDNSAGNRTEYLIVSIAGESVRFARGRR